MLFLATATLWQGLLQPALDPNKSAPVQNLSLARDRVRLTLSQGTIQFTAPLEGLVYGAAFEGQGRLQLQPPAGPETQQLRLFTSKELLDTSFTEAVFHFGDATYDELAPKLPFTPAASPRLSRLYQEHRNDRSELGADVAPRIFKSLVSAGRPRASFFGAELKTADHGWIEVWFDALDLEEISAGRWATPLSGGSRGFETWLSFPVGDRRTPKDDFRVSSYRIEAAVASSAELRAAARATLELLIPAERALLFELDSNLRVESVKDGDRALEFYQPRDPKGRPRSYGDWVVVVLPEPSQRGRALTLEFRYAGKHVIRKFGSGNFFCQSYGWYPAHPESFTSRTDFHLLFRSPKDYQLVATGSKVAETRDGNTVITEWKSDLPLAVAGFAFGDFRVYTEKAGATDVVVYANRRPDDAMASLTLDQGFGPPTSELPAIGNLSPAALAKTMGIETANTVRLFERYFGPYPYKTLALTNIPYGYGQGWPGLLYISALSFLDSTQRNALGISRHTELTDFFRAHEASHQWWGHRVSWKTYHDQWLSEGFAQFSGNLYVLYRQNEKEFATRLRLDREELVARDRRNRVYESIGPVWMGRRLSSADSPGAYSVIVYNKGGLVLNYLRSLLFDPRSQPADARFMTLMQDFTKSYHNQAASTEDFKAIAEKHLVAHMDLDGNGRLDWFFNQYVYGTGLPRYEFKYQVQAAGENQWKITGAVTPREVPPNWKDLLRLYLHAQGKVVRLGWLPAGSQEKPFDFTLPFKPDKLSVNANEDTPAEVKQ
jgi:hypothetical protein